MPKVNSSSQFPFYRSSEKKEEYNIITNMNSKSQRDLNQGLKASSRNNVDEKLSQVLNQPYYRNLSGEGNRKPNVNDYCDDSPFKIKDVNSKQNIGSNMKMRESNYKNLLNGRNRGLGSKSMIF